MKRLICLLALSTVSLLAADITGTWKGSAETPNGTVERTFVFKADGNKLAGETSSNMFGKSTIDDGKIDGDSISFNVKVNVQGNDAKVEYKGKVEGNQIKFSVEIPAMSYKVEYTAHRVP
ncbi:MAG TPA: hypothetical protein VHZ55_21560 [Bryobacteraceae bacterium]|jgi:hypothetical protein|nr:hypothetical protein [Bryobacteraceae bacterium]